MNLERLLAHARGDEPADLLLEERAGGQRAERRDRRDRRGDRPIADRGARAITRRARRSISAASFLAPGFIDAHVHIESALVPPAEFARAVVPCGTTSVVTDPHEIANVLGLDGIRFMFDSAKFGPLSMYVMASSCVPATTMETSGAVLEAHDLVSFKSDPWVLGLAEVMNFPGRRARRSRGAREDSHVCRSASSTATRRR